MVKMVEMVKNGIFLFILFITSYTSLDIDDNLEVVEHYFPEKFLK